MFARRLVERGAGSPTGLPTIPRAVLVARTRATETTLPFRSKSARADSQASSASVGRYRRGREPRANAANASPCSSKTPAPRGEASIVSLDERQRILQLTGACERLRTHAPGDGERRQVPGRSELERLAALRQRFLEATLPIERLGKDCRVRRAPLSLAGRTQFFARGGRGSPRRARGLRRATRPRRRAPPSSSRARRPRGTHVSRVALPRGVHARGRCACPSPRAPRASGG